MKLIDLVNDLKQKEHQVRTLERKMESTMAKRGSKCAYNKNSRAFEDCPCPECRKIEEMLDEQLQTMDEMKQTARNKIIVDVFDGQLTGAKLIEVIFKIVQEFDKEKNNAG